VKTVVELTYRGCQYHSQNLLSEQKIEADKTRDDRVTLIYRGQNYERQLHSRKTQKFHLENNIDEKIKLIYRTREYYLNVS
jgi:hypothetical protein